MQPLFFIFYSDITISFHGQQSRLLNCFTSLAENQYSKISSLADTLTARFIGCNKRDLVHIKFRFRLTLFSVVPGFMWYVCLRGLGCLCVCGGGLCGIAGSLSFPILRRNGCLGRRDGDCLQTGALPFSGSLELQREAGEYNLWFLRRVASINTQNGGDGGGGRTPPFFFACPTLLFHALAHSLRITIPSVSSIM